MKSSTVRVDKPSGFYYIDKSQSKTAQQAELAELVDALDSGSSVCKDFRVQVPGSASKAS